ncbi:MAG TPA: DUF1588 domain-containing protein, partial [Polyangiaceae bacterium]|nr:DUF1588 domain-containing protein [Polyangiaceae bacterium]
AVANFHAQWLAFGGLPAKPKSAPEYTVQVVGGLLDEVTYFVDDVFWNDGKIETLLTAPYTYLNDSLATYYGITPPGSTGFVKVSLNNGQRAGVLTQGALMAMLAYEAQTSPIHRGKFVREHILCQEISPPPPSIANVVKPPTVDPNVVTRERFEQHSKDPTCATCHKMMDPIGVGFEHFDEIGRWRDMDGQFQIDATGEIFGTEDADGAFDGPVELGKKLAGSSEVRACVSKEWFRFANGRAETDLDNCTLAFLNENLEAAGHDMKALMIKMTVSDAFRYRAAEGGGQ